MKSLFEQFGGAYHKESNYLIPNLTLSASEEMDIGIYGQQHLQYLQKYRRLTYICSQVENYINIFLRLIIKPTKDFCGL